MKGGTMVQVQVDELLGICYDLDCFLCILHSESRMRKPPLWFSRFEPTGLHMGKLKSQETAFRDQNPFAGI